MPELPSGTVTFLFTDLEGSTALWERQSEAMRLALARHDALVRAAIEEHGGHVVKTMGDAFHAVFRDASDALAAAVDAQRRLHAEPWGEIGALRVRMALHTGTTEERDGDYYGPPLNRVARIMSAAHGGQLLLSGLTAELVRGALPAGTRLLDLGEHRLKDLIQPERIFQVSVPDLPTDFPPLRTLNAHPNNLPTQPTALLGREREVAELRRLLEGGARLVTLTGPGGTGKTRLSIQVAAELLDHVADGVFLVDLAAIRDPSLVPASIARVLDVRDAGSRSVLDRLKDLVREKSLLLVLDNFEQILPAAPVVAELLTASPGLKVLVTSREPLRLRGEHEYPVPPLPVPAAGQVAALEQPSRYAAVSLFVERAATIRPGFALTSENAAAIAEICVRLDGLPLAIELAAARVRLLTPQAIVGRLDRRLPLLTGGARDLPARQQTLRDTIAWSHDLLDEPERRLFRRLGVFVGGWSLESAHAVCRIEQFDVNTLDRLESLVARSLVRQDDDASGDVRFRMLETIREYALEELEASGELPALRRRHAEHVLALAEESEPHIEGSDAERWLDRLQTEHDNIRTALAWSLGDDGDVALGIQLAGSIARFWQVRSHSIEGQRWYHELLPAGRHVPGRALVKALNGAGWLAHNRGDVQAALSLFGEAVAHARIHGDRSLLGHTVGNLGITMESLGDYERAEQLLEESLALFRELGRRGGVAARLHNLGNVACARGDFERAIALLEESLAIRRELGGTYSTALTVGGLGLVWLYQGNHDRALPYFEESLSLFRQLGHTYGIPWSLYYVGRLALLRGDNGAATSLLLESLAGRRRLEDRRGIAQSLEGIAALAVARRQTERAIRLFAAADRLRTSIAAPLAPAERTAYERDVALACAQAAESTFESVWAEGRAMTLEQTIDLALADPGEDAPARPS